MWLGTTVWNGIALERMLHRTETFLLGLSLYSQHQEQCLTLGVKERREEGGWDRDKVSALVELKIE